MYPCLPPPSDLSPKDPSRLEFDRYIRVIRNRKANRLKRIFFGTIILLFGTVLLIFIWEACKTGASLSVQATFPFFSVPATVETLPQDAPPKEETALPEETTREDVSAGVLVPSQPKEKSIYDYDVSLVPNGETPIVPMDLSLSHLGNEYILNDTGYTPDIEALQNTQISFQEEFSYLTSSNVSSPKVLILHTHGTEAYMKGGAISYLDTGGELGRSSHTEENVVAVGKALCDALNEAGVSAIQCSYLHDGLQYKDSYTRAEETIRTYMEQYPSIVLVIDLHRDAIIRSTGELIRPIAEWEEKAAAQVMCVVGSDWGGEDCPNWERNLALSLQLRERLNDICPNICRPTSLRSSTYNQELAPASLLLEVGSVGNSLEEAIRTAKIIGIALADLIK